MPKLILDVYHGERGINLFPWVEKHNLWGIIAKCGGSDDRTWGRYEETTWIEHVTQASSLGLHIGAYYYSNALTVDDALADAKHCVNQCMRNMAIDMPIYLDIEERSQLDLSINQLTDVVTTFCDYVNNAGYKVGIYSGYEGFNNMYESKIAKYSLWVASWGTSWPTWAKDYDIWQEGSMSLDGTRYHKAYNVDGPGCIDLDWASDTFAQQIETGKKTMKKINPADVAAKIHYDMVKDERNGYSQSPRWGGDHPDGVKHLTIDGRDYEYPLGSMDCSSSSSTAWRQALRYTKYEGKLGTGPYDGATYTADFEEAFLSTGLFMSSFTPAKRGDLYLNPGHHVAMCQDGGSDGVFGYDCLSEFNRNEYHGATGGKVGDQDGGESVIRGYYNYPWTTVLHYVGGLLDDISDTSGNEDAIEEGNNMIPVFVRLDGDQTEHLFIPLSGELHAIANNDEKQALIKLYKLANIDLDPSCKILGEKDTPWGARANDALMRGAVFSGSNRFEQHKSVEQIIDSAVSKILAKIQTNQNNQAILNKVKVGDK